MKIFIVGAGFTGIQLAKRLINEKNDVVLIDNDEEIVRHASNRLDCTVLQADGNSLKNLEDAGIAKADALVCVTQNDEVNMITCSLVDAVYPKLLKIARVRNDSYYINRQTAKTKHAETFNENHRPLYGIDYMIHPDVEAANAIVRAVEHGAVSDVLSLGDNEYELTALEIVKDSPLDGIALKNIRTLTDCKFIVTFVETREGPALPSGETVLHAGDRIGILTSNQSVVKILEISGTKVDALKKVGLVGAGRIGSIVAEHLVQKNNSSLFKRILSNAHAKFTQDFLIVDADEAACKVASEKFPTAKVFCADVTDQGFIQEEGLNNCNLVICATHNHEMNMVVSAYLESLGVEKTVALVGHSDFAEIARKLGVDVPISLRDAVVDSIMSHLLGKGVKGLHTVCDGTFEIVECDLSPKSRFVGKALKDIASPGEFLVLLVKKASTGHYELPAGGSILEAGDHIVLIEDVGNKKIIESFSGNLD